MAPIVTSVSKQLHAPPASPVVAVRLHASSADRHRAPRCTRVRRPVIERPLADASRACLEPSPGPVPHRDHGGAYNLTERTIHAITYRHERRALRGKPDAQPSAVRGLLENPANTLWSGGSVVGEQEYAQGLSKFTRAVEIGRGDGRRGIWCAAEVTQREPFEEPGDVVEEVGTVFAVDRVDEILNERQRARRRVSSTGLRTARQQVSALHLRAETLPCAVFARTFPMPAGGRNGKRLRSLRSQ